MNTDELIRQAFERQAQNAPDAGRVLAGFRARARHARRRRALIRVVVSAAAAAAVPVALVAVVGQDSTSGRPEPIDRRAQAGPPPAPVPLLYRPTWVPREFTEVVRTVGMGDEKGGQVRSWGDRSQQGRHSGYAGHAVVDVKVEPSGRGGREDVLQWLSRQPDNETPVMVKGHRAERRRDGVSCVVVWRPTAEHVLSVTVRYIGDACGDAVRVARSVVRDHQATVVSPLRVDWLPAGYVPTRTILSRTQPDCHAQVVAVNGAHSISVEIGEASLDSAGLTRLIGGRRARYHPGSPEEPGNTMAVDLGAGRLLVVHDVGSGPGLGEQALGQIAADTSVGDIAKACSWPTP